MKKIKLLLTMVAIVFSTMICCSMSAFALTEGDWEFQLLDNEVIITDYIGEGGDVIIPKTIYGRPVAKLAERCLSGDSKTYILNSVTVLAEVKEIPHGFMETNYSAEKVVLPDSVEVIENYAFDNCTKLKSINIPSNVKRIGEYAFDGCVSLEEIKFPASLEEIGRRAFDGSGLKTVDLSCCERLTFEKLGWNIFWDCKSLTSVKFHDSLTALPNECFRGCISLTDVQLPAELVEIGYRTFYECSSLKNIILPTNLKKISDLAFEGCSTLREMVIPYGTEHIAGSPFRSCDNLQSLYIPDTVTDIYKGIIDGADNCIIYCSSGSKTEEVCKAGRVSYLTDNSVNSKITVLYNGTRISFHSYGQNPELIESRTLVPLRSIFEAMGAEVAWDGATSTAIAKRGGVEIKIQIGAGEMYKDGKSISVDVPAMLLNDRTMVPIRVIAEAFGADVQWNGNGRTVLIAE